MSFKGSRSTPSRFALRKPGLSDSVWRLAEVQSKLLPCIFRKKKGQYPTLIQLTIPYISLQKQSRKTKSHSCGKYQSVSQCAQTIIECSLCRFKVTCSLSRNPSLTAQRSTLKHQRQYVTIVQDIKEIAFYCFYVKKKPKDQNQNKTKAVAICLQLSYTQKLALPRILIMVQFSKFVVNEQFHTFLFNSQPFCDWLLLIKTRKFKFEKLRLSKNGRYGKINF